MTGNLSMSCLFLNRKERTPQGATTKSKRSTDGFSMRIKPCSMLNKSFNREKFRVAALLHADILASSVTLPLEILTGASQALGRTGVRPLDIACFGGVGGMLPIQSGINLHSPTERPGRYGLINRACDLAATSAGPETGVETGGFGRTAHRHGGIDRERGIGKFLVGRDRPDDGPLHDHALAVVRRVCAMLPFGSARATTTDHPVRVRLLCQQRQLRSRFDGLSLREIFSPAWHGTLRVSFLRRSVRGFHPPRWGRRATCIMTSSWQTCRSSCCVI